MPRGSNESWLSNQNFTVYYALQGSSYFKVFLLIRVLSCGPVYYAAQGGSLHIVLINYYSMGLLLINKTLVCYR